MTEIGRLHPDNGRSVGELSAKNTHDILLSLVWHQQRPSPSQRGHQASSNWGTRSAGLTLPGTACHCVPTRRRKRGTQWHACIHNVVTGSLQPDSDLPAYTSAVVVPRLLNAQTPHRGAQVAPEERYALRFRESGRVVEGAFFDRIALRWSSGCRHRSGAVARTGAQAGRLAGV